LAATAGSLALSLGLGLKACPLCFYQRSFAMAALAVLAVGLVTDRKNPARVCLLAVPLAWAGLGVAGFHEYLVLNGTLECPLGLLGIGTSPAQSLTVFIVLALVCTIGAASDRTAAIAPKAVLVAAAILLGAAMSWASIASSPPLKARTKPYDPITEPFDGCRRPYVETK
jgi:disulfide bond formation protein DsbB